jgi:hypothetical protein
VIRKPHFPFALAGYQSFLHLEHCIRFDCPDLPHGERSKHVVASCGSYRCAGFFDDREPFGRMFTSGQLENMFQKEIAGPAIWVDSLSIVQSAAEMVVIYPGDIELRRAVTDAWSVLAEKTIMGRAVWEFRSKKLLGVI